jgi:hypothetical protein
MLHRKHPNGCCRSGNEQRKRDLAVEMEHELAHNCLLGKPYKYIFLFIFIKRLNFLHGPQYCGCWSLTQAVLNTSVKFVMISWVVRQRGPTYPSMFCAVSVLFTTILDSLLLGHDLSVGRYCIPLIIPRH